MCIRDRRIGELAREWTAGATTAEEKAAAIERHLEADYRWDKDTPSKQAKEPIDHFLFESKTGHCEFFSSSMAVMLRSVGVPTRTVNGFAGGKYNSYGCLLYTSDAADERSSVDLGGRRIIKKKTIIEVWRIVRVSKSV